MFILLIFKIFYWGRLPVNNGRRTSNVMRTTDWESMLYVIDRTVP